MLALIFNRLNRFERRMMESFGTEISTPAERFKAYVHFYFFDHGILRGLWANQSQIAPGVWRSNQPSPARMRRLKRMGIRSILNLRGQDPLPHYFFERESAGALGFELHDHKILARTLVDRQHFLELFEIFDRIEKPFVMHCKSGADRAGLVSALWLLDKEGAPLAEARKMLSLRYAHLKNSRAGLMGHVLDVYGADTARAAMPIRQWFAERYDPVAITSSFYSKMGWPLPEPK